MRRVTRDNLNSVTASGPRQLVYMLQENIFILIPERKVQKYRHLYSFPKRTLFLLKHVSMYYNLNISINPFIYI